MRQREKEMKETTEKKLVEFIKTIETKEQEILEFQEKHKRIQHFLNQNSKEFQWKEKELPEKSNEFNNFKEAQVNLNEKYKKLLMSKDSLELKEKIKKFKDESRNKKNSDSMEILEMKEIKKKMRNEKLILNQKK